MKKFKILYDGEVIHNNLSHEDAIEILQDLSEKYYRGEDNFDANLLKMEDVDGTKTTNG
tara:strand:+ start:363 stop:539 length:177 start_codon:yes stop_codon:yes gene_type:complete